MSEKVISELKQQNRDLQIRLKALEYAFMISVVGMDRESCKKITDGFEPLQQELLKTMTDAEARENAEVTRKLKELLRHVFIQGGKPYQ